MATSLWIGARVVFAITGGRGLSVRKDSIGSKVKNQLIKITNHTAFSRRQEPLMLLFSFLPPGTMWRWRQLLMCSTGSMGGESMKVKLDCW